MTNNNLPEIIRNGLQSPLPGEEAQFRMAHVSRKYAISPPKEVYLAAVLALLYPKEEEWNLVFIERKSNNPKDRHKGQIGFPGGRNEPEDIDLGETAVRETEEEVGVPRSDIELLGPLSELYIPVSNFLVAPYVGMIPYTPTFKPQASEVESIVEAPFLPFTAPEAVQQTNLIVGKGIRLNQVPYFDLNGKVLWGATAMMLSELLEVYQQSSKGSLANS